MTNVTISPKSCRILVDLVSQEIQRLAVDANMYDFYRVKTSHTERAARRRRELKSVLDELQDQEATA